MLLIRLRTVTV